MSWPLGSLAELSLVTNGKTPSKADKRSEGHPVLKIRDVNELGQFRGIGGSFVDISFAKKFRSKWALPGDTLVLNAAHNADYVGSKSFFVTEPAAGTLVTGEWLIVRPDQTRLDAHYAYFWLTSTSAKSEIKELVKGIHLYPKDVARLQIPLPPLAEQRRIAAILDQADALRRKRAEALSRLNALGQAIFYEMFGDPLAPDGVHVTRLADIAELINGDRSSNYPSGKDIKETGIVFLNTTNIKVGELDFAKSQFINEQKFASLSRGKLKRGDLVITLRGTLGQCALFDCGFETGFINAQMMIIRCGQRAIPRFLKEYISFPSVQAALKGANSGSAVPQLTAAQMKELKVKLPSIDEQRKFVTFVDAANHSQAKQMAQYKQLDNLFQTLQHRAFRGEL